MRYCCHIYKILKASCQYYYLTTSIINMLHFVTTVMIPCQRQWPMPDNNCTCIITRYVNLFRIYGEVNSSRFRISRLFSTPLVYHSLQNASCESLLFQTYRSILRESSTKPFLFDVTYETSTSETVNVVSNQLITI